MLCSPSRASFLTGMYAHIHTVCVNQLNDPDKELPTFNQELKKAEYETTYIGKWHMEFHTCDVNKISDIKYHKILRRYVLKGDEYA